MDSIQIVGFYGCYRGLFGREYDQSNRRIRWANGDNLDSYCPISYDVRGQ